MRAREILESLGVRPSKQRGQNFLVNDSIAESLVRRMNLETSAAVLEVGPGLGAITRYLLECTTKLYVVDIEAKFCSYLAGAFSELREGQIICADVCRLDLEPLSRESVQKLVVVGNVPYSISTDIILWLIKNRQNICRASLLMQREFAERLAASPGGKEYGSLSVFCRLYADATLETVVPGSEFFPKAEVESQVVEFNFLAEPRLNVDPEVFQRVVRASFSARRKTLLNCLLRGGLGIAISREEISSLLLNCEIEPTRRAETLSLDEFGKITGALEPLLKLQL